MKDPIKLINIAWKAGLASLVVMIMVFGGLFLNLSAVSATDASPTPTPSASPSVSPSPTMSPTPTPTSTPSPMVSPSPQTQNPPSFPKCIDQSGTGDRAHYDSGQHQIVGNGLLQGKDDVYTLSNGNFLQCFVPPLKDVCIQTDWWRTDLVLEGWNSVNGSQWNLGNFHYLARNHNYNCHAERSPTPTPVASPTPIPCTSCGATTITINNKNEQHQEQHQDQHQEQTGTVAGATTVPTKTPETGVGVLGMAGMFSAAPVGVVLSRFGKGRITGKKEEDINEIAMGIIDNKRAKSNEV